MTAGRLGHSPPSEKLDTKQAPEVKGTNVPKRKDEAR